jgi:DNA repair exonuclease SbcCD ATPase subunit
MQEADKAEAHLTQLVSSGFTAADLVAEAQIAFAEVEARYNEAKRLADNAEHILKAHAEAVRVSTEFAKATEFIRTLEENLAQATARLAEAKASPVIQGVADPAQSLRQFGQLLAVASARVTTAEQAWVRYTNTPDTCPTCKQPMQKDSSCASDLQAEFEESKRDHARLQAEYAAFEQAANLLQRAESNFNSYNTEMRYKRDAFQELQVRATKTQGDLLTPERLAVLNAANKELADSSVLHTVAKQKLDNANANREQLRAQYAVWSQKVREHKANPLNAACVPFRQDPVLMPAEMQAAQQQQEFCKQKYLLKIQRLAQRDTVLKELQRLEAQRQKLLQDEANQQLSEQKYAQLVRVAELLHSDAVPKYIATQNLQLLQGEINRILGELSAKFRLKAEDDLTLVATWPDGREQPLSRLSGGQKTVVAAVFRIAMSTVFTNNIGFLVLDEPTAFQDRAHIQGLIPALEALERYAENTGMQLLVVTHEPLLHPVFKRLIDLSA